ncbi:hypothetical protein V6N11_031875 [Hibiscus sabdariffa]|uniref:Uncharacterized protein n=1 Tax=Hibiscus sabdariffa TaxID=183260 RepID=A0ABR2SYZ5_9ROSI
MEVNGTETANLCPTIDCGVGSFAFKPGKYYAKKFCLEPNSFTVKAEGANPRASVGTSSYRPTVVRLSWTQNEGDTDLGAKTPKDVKITGIWFAQC